MKLKLIRNGSITYCTDYNQLPILKKDGWVEEDKILIPTESTEDEQSGKKQPAKRGRKPKSMSMDSNHSLEESSNE